MFNVLSLLVMAVLCAGSMVSFFISNSSSYTFSFLAGMFLSSLGALYFANKIVTKEHQEKTILGKISLGKISHFGYTKYSNSYWGTQIYTQDNHAFVITSELKDLEKDEEIFLTAYSGGVSGKNYFLIVRNNGKEYGFEKSNFNLEKFNKIFEEQNLKVKNTELNIPFAEGIPPALVLITGKIVNIFHAFNKQKNENKIALSLPEYSKEKYRKIGYCFRFFVEERDLLDDLVEYFENNSFIEKHFDIRGVKKVNKEKIIKYSAFISKKIPRRLQEINGLYNGLNTEN